MSWHNTKIESKEWYNYNYYCNFVEMKDYFNLKISKAITRIWNSKYKNFKQNAQL